jgi:hypothetical protein
VWAGPFWIRVGEESGLGRCVGGLVWFVVCFDLVVSEQPRVPRQPSYEELLVENAGLKAENGQLCEGLAAAVVRIGELEARQDDVEELR